MLGWAQFTDSLIPEFIVGDWRLLASAKLIPLKISPALTEAELKFIDPHL